MKLYFDLWKLTIDYLKCWLAYLFSKFEEFQTVFCTPVVAVPSAWHWGHLLQVHNMQSRREKQSEEKVKSERITKKEKERDKVKNS